jgi:hypothetical protein
MMEEILVVIMQLSTLAFVISSMLAMGLNLTISGLINYGYSSKGGSKATTSNTRIRAEISPLNLSLLTHLIQPIEYE